MARESIEALLNPSLRVSRPVAACARCRSAKIKCDGKLPACSACERAGKAQDCSSANDEFARGKERSYVSALETAIQRLQKRIEAAKGLDDRRDSAMSFSMLRRPSMQQRKISGSKRKEASDVDELVSDFGFLTVNATSRDFNGFTSTMSFTRLLLATAMRPGAPEPLDTPLPSRQSTTPLINFYFENLYVMLPFFSETDFMSSLSRVYSDPDAQGLATPHDIWTVRLVLAIAASSLCHHQDDELSLSSSQHISAALRVAEYVLHPGALSGIQALLLLVQYALNSPHHFDCWYVVGMASRLLVDLGLHCEPSPEAKISKQALDLRRRVFYCTYAIDRLVSMSFGLAFSFTDDSAPTVLLPTLAIEQEQRSPSQLFLRSVKPSLFVFDIRRLQSSFYQRTRWSARKQWDAHIANEYLTSTLNDIEQWRQMLPDSLTMPHSRLFYLEYLYSKILVVSPNQVVPISLLSRENKAHIFNYTIQYAEQIHQMTQDHSSLSLLTIADFYKTRYVAQQFLNLMWSEFDAVLRKELHMDDHSMTSLSITQKSITFFTLVSKVLDIANQRWSTSELRQRFEQESAVLLGRLKARFQELSTMPATGPAMPVTSSFNQDTTSMPQMYNPSETIVPHDQILLNSDEYDLLQLQQQPPSMQQTYQHEQQPLIYNPNTADNAYPQPHTMFDPLHLSPEQSTPPHGNLQRAATWTAQGQSSGLPLPPGPMTRRSYEFNG